MQAQNLKFKKWFQNSKISNRCDPDIPNPDPCTVAPDPRGSRDSGHGTRDLPLYRNLLSISIHIGMEFTLESKVNCYVIHISATKSGPHNSSDNLFIVAAEVTVFPVLFCHQISHI